MRFPESTDHLEVWQEQTAIAQALLTAGAQSAAASKAAFCLVIIFIVAVWRR